MSFEPPITLQVGDRAPDFTAPANGGGTVSLAEFKGRTVVLYFYPRDNTPGCTQEACGFRDLHARFTRRQAAILGVSVDGVKSHDKFVGKLGLPFTLVADTDQTITKAYGVWGRKKFMGREFDGVHRVTFLIGPDGRIKKIWPKVKSATHAEEVLGALNG